MINTKSWAVELNGQHELFENDQGTRFVKKFRDSNKSIQLQLFYHRVQIGSSWFPSSYNPGLHVRNRYGSSIYKHVEHWLSLGKFQV